ncbi:MAG: laccase domain-containing protein [Burkholderiales bacterium]
MEGNDSRPNWCTYSQPELYYSHRRDGVSGRFAAGIALV